MNCVVRFLEVAKTHPDRMALWTEKTGPVSFKELHEATCRAQALFISRGVRPGDAVVIAALPGVGLFASILALLGIGAPILLIEPWLPVERINHIVQMMSPRVFFTGFIGKVWAWRIPEMRKIPYWDTESSIRSQPLKPFHVEDLPPDAPAVIAFSSGNDRRSERRDPNPEVPLGDARNSLQARSPRLLFRYVSRP
jgi:acyl-CoA synthetase (AMP-forming)/AMP-acid ligase II